MRCWGLTWLSSKEVRPPNRIRRPSWLSWTRQTLQSRRVPLTKDLKKLWPRIRMASAFLHRTWRTALTLVWRTHWRRMREGPRSTSLATKTHQASSREMVRTVILLTSISTIRTARRRRCSWASKIWEDMETEIWWQPTSNLLAATKSASREFSAQSIDPAQARELKTSHPRSRSWRRETTNLDRRKDRRRRRRMEMSMRWDKMTTFRKTSMWASKSSRSRRDRSTWSRRLNKFESNGKNEGFWYRKMSVRW